MADEEINNYPVRQSEETDNSNSQFPDPSEPLQEQDVKSRVNKNFHCLCLFTPIVFL